MDDDKNTTLFSDLCQLDGNISESVSSESTLDSSSSSYGTDEEVEPILTPANLTVQNSSNPSVQLEVKVSSKVQNSSCLPLISLLNARSLYLKKLSFKKFIMELGVEIAIVSETWERENESLEKLLQLNNYKIISYKRPKVKATKQPGGGCALIFCENRFHISQIFVNIPSGVEAVWSLVEPKQPNPKVKRIAMCSVYVSPASKFKTKTINHIVETIHLLRAKHGNEISFLVGGDLNQLNINPILQCYGALKQLITEGTRNSAILEHIITDLQGYYHPPACIAPLEVDDVEQGKDSDHNIVMLAPISIPSSGQKRKKKTIVTRPLPESQMEKFGKFTTKHNWDEVISVDDVNSKVENFHNTLIQKLNMYFPQKTMKISSLDKNFMNPELKQLQRQTQREFYKNRKSIKWKKLKRKFKKLKKITVRKFYDSFVNDLKDTNPSKWYQMAKKIGAVNSSNDNDLKVDALAGLDDHESAEHIAQHFAAISQEYLPLNPSALPAFLPAPPPPRITEIEVYKRLLKLKKTKSTQPIQVKKRILSRTCLSSF